eukprot:UN26955
MKGIKKKKLDMKSYATGEEYRTKYLCPLAKYIENHKNAKLMMNTEVKTITRKKYGKTDLLWAKRFKGKFRLLIEKEKNESLLYTDIVIDCSGVFNQPLPFGTGGSFALGEQKY